MRNRYVALCVDYSMTVILKLQRQGLQRKRRRLPGGEKGIGQEGDVNDWRCVYGGILCKVQEKTGNAGC